MLHYCWEDVKDARAGDVVTIGGKRFLIQKKTSTAIAVRRWYWFDQAIQSIHRAFAERVS